MTVLPRTANRHGRAARGRVRGGGKVKLPDVHRDTRLLSVRRSADHLFLRYELHPSA